MRGRGVIWIITIIIALGLVLAVVSRGEMASEAATQPLVAQQTGPAASIVLHGVVEKSGIPPGTVGAFQEIDWYSKTDPVSLDSWGADFPPGPVEWSGDDTLTPRLTFPAVGQYVVNFQFTTGVQDLDADGNPVPGTRQVFLQHNWGALVTVQPRSSSNIFDGWEPAVIRIREGQRVTVPEGRFDP